MKTFLALSTLIAGVLLLTGCGKEEMIKPRESNPASSRLTGTTNLLVTMTTGSDDLRGGNRAYISLVLTDGRSTGEQVLSTGMVSHSTSDIRVSVPGAVTLDQIRSIRVRHDGSPRAGYPFDSYDNWDLKFIRVRIADAYFVATNLLYNSNTDSQVGTLVTRFTGSSRLLIRPIRAIGTEPDFIIQSFYNTPSGLTVVIKNQGPGSGKVTRVTASSFGRSMVHYASLTLAPNQTGTVRLSTTFFGSVACTITGVDAYGRPEVVTAINKRTLTL